MNGNLSYELKIENKINHVLSNNPKLSGFYTYMTSVTLSTAHTYLINVAAFLNYTNKEFNELTLDDFSSYMSHIKRNKYGDKSTASYKITVYSALKKFGKYLVATHILPDNPMDHIERPKSKESQKTIEKRNVGFLTEKEIDRYIKTVKFGAGSARSIARQEKWKERDMAIIILFLSTGIRCSALMKLDVNSIDFDNKTIIVTDKEELVYSCDLSDKVLDVIQDWLVVRENIMKDTQDEPALFVSNRKHRMDQKSIYLLVNKYAEAIPKKHITPHKLRATYGTQLYNKTKDIYFVQENMHHASPQTTENYIRGNNGTSKKASNIIDSILP